MKDWERMKNMCNGEENRYTEKGQEYETTKKRIPRREEKQTNKEKQTVKHEGTKHLCRL